MASIMEAIKSLIEVHKKHGNIPIGVRINDQVHNLNGVVVAVDEFAVLGDGEKTLFCHVMAESDPINPCCGGLVGRRYH